MQFGFGRAGRRAVQARPRGAAGGLRRCRAGGGGRREPVERTQVRQRGPAGQRVEARRRAHSRAQFAGGCPTAEAERLALGPRGGDLGFQVAPCAGPELAERLPRAQLAHQRVAHFLQLEIGARRAGLRHAHCGDVFAGNDFVHQPRPHAEIALVRQQTVDGRGLHQFLEGRHALVQWAGQVQYGRVGRVWRRHAHLRRGRGFGAADLGFVGGWRQAQRRRGLGRGRGGGLLRIPAQRRLCPRATTVLQHVREFVPEQSLAVAGVRPVLAGAEGDVRTEGEGTGVQLRRAGGGLGIVVDADVGQVGLVVRLEEAALAVAEAARMAQRQVGRTGRQAVAARLAAHGAMRRGLAMGARRLAGRAGAAGGPGDGIGGQRGIGHAVGFGFFGVAGCAHRVLGADLATRAEVLQGQVAKRRGAGKPGAGGVGARVRLAPGLGGLPGPVGAGGVGGAVGVGSGLHGVRGRLRRTGWRSRSGGVPRPGPSPWDPGSYRGWAAYSPLACPRPISLPSCHPASSGR
ncbi:hypothetical protein D9M72_313700 [compost metagenome]